MRTGPGKKERDAEYQRQWRRRNGDQRNRQVNRARIRARTRLAEMYPGVFARLLDEECGELGIPTIGEVAIGRPRVTPR